MGAGFCKNHDKLMNYTDRVVRSARFDIRNLTINRNFNFKSVIRGCPEATNPVYFLIGEKVFSYKSHVIEALECHFMSFFHDMA
jgi:hypothetical protein